jgi:xanthine/CO dehydrogenase XdhC/CoxF family maturation factor
MIGSKRKVIGIFKTLQAEGVPAHLFDRVHAPIGLDIGAVTPEEIAVAITAELIAIRRHASSALPHLSWFQGAREESGAGATAEAIENAIDERDRHR